MLMLRVCISRQPIQTRIVVDKFATYDFASKAWRISQLLSMADGSRKRSTLAQQEPTWDELPTACGLVGVGKER